MKLAFIGTGAYSVGLAIAMAQNKENQIVLWTEDETLKKEYDTTKKILKFSEKRLTKNICIKTDLKEAIEGSQAIFLLTASKYIPSIIKQIKPYYKKTIPLFLGSKGLDEEKNTLLSVRIRSILKPKYYGSFAGPSFAKDLLHLDPITLNLASKEAYTKRIFKRITKDTPLSIQNMSSIEALEYLSALKNCIALACGYLHGLGYGASTNLSFLTKAFQDCIKLAYSLNFDPYTLYEPCGIGDFFLTCCSTESRNFTYGAYMAKNRKKAEEYQKKNTVEGIDTLLIFSKIIKKRKIKNELMTLLFSLFLEEPNKETILAYIKK